MASNRSNVKPVRHQAHPNHEAPTPTEGPSSDEGRLYIRQAAALVAMTPALLRECERHRLITPARTESGYRVYSMQDVDRLRRIKALLDDGVNLAGVRRILEGGAPSSGDDDRVPRGRGHRSKTTGGKLKESRNRRGLSLRQVAEQTGLSASYLSAIERGLALPSLATLSELASFFETNVLALLSDTESVADSPLVRAGERRVISGKAGVTIEDMSTAGNDLEPLLLLIEPGAGSDGRLSHVGEEWLFILEGEMCLELDATEQFHLGPGDSMSFDSQRLHKFTNEGTSLVRVLWVNTPRTF